MKSGDETVRLSRIGVNPEEAKAAKEYWSTTESQDRTFSSVLPMNARLLLSAIAKCQPTSVFEFGCNAGRNLKLIRDTCSYRPIVMRGCDINEESVGYGRTQWGLDLTVGDETHLRTIDDSAYDLVFTISVLDHLPRCGDILAQLVRIAREYIFLLEPTRSDRAGISAKATSFRGCDEGEWEDATPFSYFHSYENMASVLGLETIAQLPTPLRLFRLGPFYELHLYRKSGEGSAFSDSIRRIASGVGRRLELASERYPDLADLLLPATDGSQAAPPLFVHIVLDDSDVDSLYGAVRDQREGPSIVVCRMECTEGVRHCVEDAEGSELRRVRRNGTLELLARADVLEQHGMSIPALPENMESQLEGRAALIATRQAARDYGMALLEWHEESTRGMRELVSKAKSSAIRDTLKYRIGDAMVRAARPSRETLSLPFRLWGLYQEAKGQSAEGKEIQSRRAKKKRSPDTPIRGVFFATNGSGLGHVTRLLAIARRVKDVDEVAEVIFLTSSSATSLIEGMGFRVYHLPGLKEFDSLVSSQEWNAQLRTQIRKLIQIEDANLLVFDGAQPYDGLCDVLHSERKRLTRVWVKRGQLRPVLEELRQHKMDRFDLVIEPGEIGADEKDDAASRVRPVPPITLLDQRDLLSRDEAIAHLGLVSALPSVLILLGAGNINDVTSLSYQAVRAALSLGLQVVVATSPISRTKIELPEGAIPTMEYPVSRLFRAFDAAVSAAGYNTVAELCRFGLPAILIPNEETGADDQVARAAAAQDCGPCRVLRPFSEEALASLLKEILGSSAGELVSRESAAIGKNGAQQAAGLICEAVRSPL